MKTGKTFYLQILLCILLLLMMLLPVFALRAAHEKNMRQIQALIGKVDMHTPEYTEEFLKILYENEVTEQEFLRGEEALHTYSYTKDGLKFLSANFFPTMVLVVSGAAAVLLLAAVFFVAARLWKGRHETEAAYQKQNEELRNDLSKMQFVEARNRDLRAFIENIAHQLKTPVSRVMGTLELMHADEKEKQECIVHVSEISALISSLIGIGRMEAGAVVFHREDLDLRTLIRDTAERSAASGKVTVAFALSDDSSKGLSTDAGPEASKELSSGVSFPWRGDYDWMQEALMNLMKNCLEHDPDSQIEIECVQEKDYYRIRIRDHGPGFSEEDLPYLFDRFYQPKNEKKGHTGIGLNLAKLILEGHHASIHAANRAEGGAEYLILLPRFETLN